MKRITTAVIAGATVATLAYASASALTVDSKPLQAGSDTVTCDENGVQVAWGLETDDNSVRNVKVADIAEACHGAKLFVAVNGVRVGSGWTITGSTTSFALKSGTTPESIENVTVWIG